MTLFVAIGVPSRWHRLAIAAAAFVLAVPVQADGNCQLGARVVDRQNRAGTVVKMDGRNSCYVKLDQGEDKPQYFLQWMLRPAGSQGAAGGRAGAKPAPAGGGGALARGRYGCWAAAGIAGTMKLDITGEGSYAGNDKAGQYRFDPGTQKIQFTSGPWGGFHGARLGPGKIGVSSRPGGSYMTTCNLK